MGSAEQKRRRREEVRRLLALFLRYFERGHHGHHISLMSTLMSTHLSPLVTGLPDRPGHLDIRLPPFYTCAQVRR